MRRRRRGHDQGVETALANFSITFAKALLVFCVPLILLISPAAKTQDGSKPKAEALISIEWSGKFGYDVDMWMRTPDGSLVWYGNKEAGGVFLERDDLGTDCNNRFGSTAQTAPEDGFSCEEVIVLRGLAPGEYVLNVQLYAARSSKTNEAVGPAQVRAKIERMNPTVAELWRGVKTLNTVQQEVHFVRFTVTASGEIKGFTDQRPVMLRVHR